MTESLGKGAVCLQSVVPGEASGVAMLSKVPLSFWGGFDPKTGRITDLRHDRYGECASGKVLFIPASRGSSSSSGVLLEAIRARTAPAAIITLTAEPILAIGSIIGRELYGRWIPIGTIKKAEFGEVADGARVSVRLAENGEGIVMFEKPNRITVSIRFFGKLAEHLGERRSVELNRPATVRDLLDHLGLDEKGISLAVVNGVQVVLDTALKDGDQVMLVPPVIGG